MYQQVLYQLGNQLNNTPQNSGNDITTRLLVTIFSLACAAGALCIAYYAKKDFEKRIKFNQYNSNGK